MQAAKCLPPAPHWKGPAAPPPSPSRLQPLQRNHCCCSRFHCSGSLNLRVLLFVWLSPVVSPPPPQCRCTSGACVAQQAIGEVSLELTAPPPRASLVLPQLFCWRRTKKRQGGRERAGDSAQVPLSPHWPPPHSASLPTAHSLTPATGLPTCSAQAGHSRTGSTAGVPKRSERLTLTMPALPATAL